MKEVVSIISWYAEELDLSDFVQLGRLQEFTNGVIKYAVYKEDIKALDSFFIKEELRNFVDEWWKKGAGSMTINLFITMLSVLTFGIAGCLYCECRDAFNELDDTIYELERQVRGLKKEIKELKEES